MSVSFAGEPRSFSAASSAAPVVVKPVSAHPAAAANSSAPAAPPVLAPPAVSPIVQTVERRLRESSYYYLRSIRCAFEAGVITLRGRVPTFYLKQTVQAIVEKIEGVEQVVNLVEVFDSRQAPLPSIRQPA
jgi:osmotically-inducible protein OsmY